MYVEHKGDADWMKQAATIRFAMHDQIHACGFGIVLIFTALHYV